MQLCVFTLSSATAKGCLNNADSVFLGHAGLSVSVSYSAGQSLDQHFMTSYYHAMLSVILGQFTRNGFPDGVQGIIKLAEGSEFIRVGHGPFLLQLISAKTPRCQQHPYLCLTTCPVTRTCCSHAPFAFRYDPSLLHAQRLSQPCIICIKTDLYQDRSSA